MSTGCGGRLLDSESFSGMVGNRLPPKSSVCPTSPSIYTARLGWRELFIYTQKCTNYTRDIVIVNPQCHQVNITRTHTGPRRRVPKPNTHPMPNHAAVQYTELTRVFLFPSGVFKKSPLDYI